MKKNRFLNIEKIVVFLQILAASGLVLATFAGNTNPNKSILIAFAGLAYPYLLLLNIISLVWWVICRRKYLAMATLAFILIGWKPLIATFQLFGDKGESTKTTPEAIRLLTYNVHEFKKYGSNNDLSTKEEIIDLIKEQKPDIICFQEFFTRKNGEYNFIKNIKKNIGLPYHYYVPFAGNDYETVGHAIFSRYPIKNTGDIIFPNDKANKSIFADISVHNKIIRIYNVHFQSISFDKEDYDYIERLKNSMNTQIKPTKRIVRMLKNAFEKRAVQTDLMKKELKKSPYPFVLAGDFNDTPASYTVTQITEGLKNAFKEKGTGLGKTYNGAFPNFQIDYIVCSNDFDVLNYQIILKKLSDHFPIRSDLRIDFP